ncbi:hypothetical protein IPJ91_03185 [bacterium]|nr:MAG: hypothetical protein IPJ91_03185 [bacterium]
MKKFIQKVEVLKLFVFIIIILQFLQPVIVIAESLPQNRENNIDGLEVIKVNGQDLLKLNQDYKDNKVHEKIINPSKTEISKFKNSNVNEVDLSQTSVDENIRNLDNTKFKTKTINIEDIDNEIKKINQNK